MTACAVRDCPHPALWLVARDNQERPACRAHADQAAALGYTIRRANPRPTLNLDQAKKAAKEREQAEHVYRRALVEARAAGATLGQLAAATGQARSTIAHHTRKPPMKED